MKTEKAIFIQGDSNLSLTELNELLSLGWKVKSTTAQFTSCSGGVGIYMTFGGFLVILERSN